MPDPTLLPPPLSGLSTWQQTVQSHPLLTSDANSPLPTSADIVIVGGGLCGAVLAHSLLQDTSTERIVLLEARELASGASGRNAGHCRPDAGRGFSTFAGIHGESQARKVLDSEKVVLRRVDSFIKANGIECEWTLRKTYDVALSQEFQSATEEANAKFAAAGGSPPEALGRAAAREAAGSEKALGAWGWDAATLNPAQLTLAVHSLCAESPRFQAFANCPVTSISPASPSQFSQPSQPSEPSESSESSQNRPSTGSESSEGGWEVHTERGVIRARKVILATNGYTPALLDLPITPVQAQAHLLSPPVKSMEHSYSLRRSNSEFYSVAPRPDGTVVLGVARLGWPEALKRGAWGNVDDGGWDRAVARQGWEAVRDVWPNGPWGDAKAGTTNGDAGAEGTQNGDAKAGGRADGDAKAGGRANGDAMAEGTSEGDAESEGKRNGNGRIRAAGESGEGQLQGMVSAWTGIVGMTPDLVPLIGPVPSQPGLYVAAGYNGHGMARIFLTAPSLAHYVVHGAWADDDQMPECFRVTPERLQKLRQKSETR